MTPSEIESKAADLASALRPAGKKNYREWEQYAVEVALALAAHISKEAHEAASIPIDEQERISEIGQARKGEDLRLSDDMNPEFLFSTTHTDLLSQIAKGTIRAKKLAMWELQKRGLDKDGFWVGYKKGLDKGR
jgi:hypothetical protein